MAPGSGVSAKPEEDGPQDRRIGRPVGVSAAVHEAVMAAARDELIEFGYREFRVERVATRASVHRSTLYRNWETPAALAREAIVTWEMAAIPVATETGNWRTDVRALCESFRDSLQQPGSLALMRTLVVANAVDAELRDVLLERWTRPEMVEMVARAQRRGDVPPHVDPGWVVELIAAPFVLRAVVTMMPMDDAFVDLVAQHVVTSIA